MTPNDKLKAVFKELLSEVEHNEPLRVRINRIIEGANDEAAAAPKSARRNPSRFDPMAVFREQPDELARRLEGLTVEELKDVVAEHGMDRAKLAMKWKSKERLVDLIVTAVRNRTQKGDAFRGP